MKPMLGLYENVLSKPQISVYVSVTSYRGKSITVHMLQRLTLTDCPNVMMSNSASLCAQHSSSALLAQSAATELRSSVLNKPELAQLIFVCPLGVSHSLLRVSLCFHPSLMNSDLVFLRTQKDQIQPHYFCVCCVS